MTKSRLWIVSELFYPEQTSTGYFLSDIARGLASYQDVEVICAQPTYSERGIKAPAHEVWAGLTIHRMRGSRFNKDRLILRLINLVTFTLSCLVFAALRIRRGDKVLVVTNPPTVFPAIVWIANIKGAKTLLLVHDVYPDVLSVTGHLSPRSIGYRVLDRIVAFSCQKYDRIIVLGRDMHAKLLAKSGIAPSRLAIIPNWADVAGVRPLPRGDNAFATRYAMGDTFTVQFSGNIGRTHDIETLLATAKSTEHRSDIQYWFIGYGGKAALLHESEAKELTNVNVLPRQPREDLGGMLASADVIVIAFVPGMTGLSVPSRMYNVMAAGTAIIAITEPESELAMVVSECDCGWVIAPNDHTALTELIVKLATSEGRALVLEKGLAGRSAACNRYTIDHVLSAYRELLNQV
jgi:colanic acid biosynthesis glycosyl transferase WcaI